jgi:hypothetical protein
MLVLPVRLRYAVDELHADKVAGMLSLVGEELQVAPEPFKILSLVGDLDLLQQAIGVFLLAGSLEQFHDFDSRYRHARVFIQILDALQRTVIFEKCGRIKESQLRYLLQHSIRGDFQPVCSFVHSRLDHFLYFNIFQQALPLGIRRPRAVTGPLCRLGRVQVDQVLCYESRLPGG